MSDNQAAATAVRRRRRALEGPGLQWICFALAWLVLIAGGSQAQYFDAAIYLDQTVDLLNGRVPVDGFAPRGALTAVVYLPAALISQLGVPLAWAVLVQTAAAIAALGAFAVPALAVRLGAQRRTAVVSSSLAVVIILGRFAPAALMDIWAVLLLTCAFVLATRLSVTRVLLAGVLLGAAVNLRPAYLLPVLLVLLVWLMELRRHTKWLVLGSGMLVLPQALLEVWRPGSFLAWVVDSANINKLQVRYAGYVTRYETDVDTTALMSARHFYCEPDMAARQDGGISTQADLAGQLARNLPHSLDLVAQKLSGWLMWDWSTPFLDPDEPNISTLSVVVVLVVVVGVAGWVAAIRRGAVPRPVGVMGATVAVGVAVGCVTGTPEARFALPLLVLGIVGVLIAGWRRPSIVHGAVMTGVAVVLLVAGQRATTHPAPPGDVTPEICAAASGAEITVAGAPSDRAQ